MSTNTVRAKEERLARIRRNQQNSRDRKRARLQELQDKVQELQRQASSQPAPGSSVVSWSERVDALAQENEALRRLLHAIGIDERGQQQYLESTMKYKAPERKPSLSVSAGVSLEHRHVALEPAVPLPQQSIAASGRDGEMASLWHEQMNTLTTLHQDLSASLSIYLVLRTTANVKQQFDEWLVEVDAMSNPTLTQPYIFDQPLPSQTPSSRHLPLDVLPSSAEDRAHDGKTSAAHEIGPEASYGAEVEPSRSTSTVSCLMNASVPVSESDSTTLCSIALQMVFRHNKKRLTMSELDRRLRCGFRSASEPSQECRVENQVLFNVLAEICV